MIRVKICCIRSLAERDLAIASGADAIGLVSGMPSGPGIVDDAFIRVASSTTPPPVSRFLLTPRLDADGIIEHVERTGVDTVQVCDHVEPDVFAEVRERSVVRVVAVVHVPDPRAEAYAAEVARFAHALLLDSGAPGADFKELGGTGRTHDWGVSARIVQSSPVPVWLAGGLASDNVADAIQTVRPFGVDLCSGVRTDGDLDPKKLAAFMTAARSATCG